MKQTINLFPPPQTLKLGLLSFHRLIVLSILFASGLILFNLSLWGWNKKIDHDIQKIQLDVNLKKMALSDILKVENGMLSRFNEKLNALNIDNTKIKKQFAAYQTISLNRSFAHDVLTAFSRTHLPDIWLNDIHVDDANQIEVGGETKNPKNLIALLNSWDQEAAIKGKTLSIIYLQKKGEAWQFRVSSKVINEHNTEH